MTPIAPAERDPALVMIGLPCLGEGNYTLVRNMVSLELQSPVERWKFKAFRCQEHGLPKARNILTHIAYLIGASTVIMCDRDIPATAAHFLRLMKHEEPLVGALYPLREVPLHWPGEFLPCTSQTIGPGGLWPMEHVASGLIRVDLKVFDAIKEKGLAPWYHHEDADTLGMITYWDKVWDFWQQRVVEDEWFTRVAGKKERFPRYVTEDYMVSYLWGKCGGKRWVDPECQVGHFINADVLDLDEKVRNKVRMELQKRGVRIPT